jgi:Tfp pilus assembly protein PilF
VAERSRSHTPITNSERYAEVTYAAAEHFNKGDFTGAVERLSEMARVNPNNIKVHEVLAHAYLKTNQVDLAEEEMKVVRKLAAELYPELKFSDAKTFDDLVAETESSKELAPRYRALLESEDINEMVKNMDVASQLSVKLMAKGEYEKAEQVITRYQERLTALREKQAT